MATEVKSHMGEFMYAVPKVEQANPLTADKVHYFSQNHSFPAGWDIVAHLCCGITSASMAISIIHPDTTPLDVLATASRLHTVPHNVPNYWLVSTSNGQEFHIPLGPNKDVDIPPAFTLTDQPPSPLTENVYAPVYSIERGYDHRGSPRLFAEFGMLAEKIGDKDQPVSISEIENRVKDNQVLMLSVKNSVTPWLAGIKDWNLNTHIILLTDIYEINKEKWYYLLDPYSPTGEKVAILRPAKSFHQVEFNGYGTAIKITNPQL